MSKCTRSQALEALEYWLGYCEKASGTYAKRRDKAAFELDKGSNNYTYAGYLCGVQGGAWCAMQISTAIREACGDVTADAKSVLRVWPYTVVKQVWNAADDAHRFYGDYQRFTLGKGDRTRYTPRPGDIIIFTDDGTTKTHTGMVYAADDTYVYTYEGNSANMCRKRSYRRDSSYVFGYVVPDYAAETEAVKTADGELYGAVCCSDPELHELSKGCAGPEVVSLQAILRGRGVTDDSGAEIEADGDFGKLTKQAVVKAQAAMGLEQDGVVGAETWPALLTNRR